MSTSLRYRPHIVHINKTPPTRRWSCRRRRRRLLDAEREERVSARGAQEGFAAAPAQDLLRGAVATRAVRNAAPGLFCCETSLESLAVEYLTAEVPDFLPRAPADVRLHRPQQEG